MAAPLAGHTNSYHTYGLDEALAGIAAAGFRGVELSAVPGWTQHLDLSGTEEIRRTLARHGLTAVSLSAHSDLTTREGLQHGVKAVRWAADAGIPIVNTAIGGHASQEENERSFLDNVGELEVRIHIPSSSESTANPTSSGADDPASTANTLRSTRRSRN